ncbi:hypothetical protein LCGC14_1532110, partial [marine sediment metagenome]
MGSGGKALGIIGLILGAGAIVFVVWNGQNTTNSDLDGLNDEFNNLESDLNNLTRIIVVGIWNAFDENQDFAPHTYQNDWLLEFLNNKL